MFRRRSLGFALTLTVALFGGAATLSGCGRPVTPAELEALEGRSYPGESRQRVFTATAGALRSLGYEVVLADPGKGRLKTAPKVFAVQAVRTSSSTAVAADASLAWTIDVAAEQAGAHVHAEPRLYRSGQSVESTRLEHDFAERSFATLYGEIADNLGGEPRSSSASAKRAPR